MRSSAPGRRSGQRAAESISPPPSGAVADRRRKLLDAGLSLFAVRGFDGVSIRDIASHAGVNIALLYHYFGDKRSLYDAVLEEAIDLEVGPQLEVLGGPGDAETRLHTFVVNLLDSILREDPKRKLIERMFMDSADGASAAVEPMRARFQPHMSAIIGEITPGGGDIPWPVISGIFNGLPHAIIRSHRTYEPARRNPTPVERERLAAMLTKIMIAAFVIAAEEARDHSKSL